jgi:iron complex outermembrane receptor protein
MWGGLFMRKKNMLKSAIAIGALVQALPAFAQDAGPAPAQAEAQGPEASDPTDTDSNEIVVTARKRAETLQSVPVVAQAFRQESLEQYGTNNIAQLTARVPDLQAGTAVNSVGTQLSLRGVGTTALNATMDQSISLNIDGLPLTQGMAYSAGLFDVGQIEVLKGPQGLYYGKNSPGGVISLRSADPTDKFEGSARFGYEFVGRDKSAELTLSGPVTDWLKVRVAGRYSDMKGYFKNAAVVIPGKGTLNPAGSQKRFPNASNTILRGTVLFEPSSNYSARLKVTYTDTNEQGSATALDVGYCPDGTGAIPPTGIPFIGGDNCKLDNVFHVPIPDGSAFPGARNNAVPFFKSKQLFGSLEQNLNLGESLKLTSVTGYYHNALSTIHLASSTGTVAVIIQDNDFYNNQFTQEVRLESDFKDSPVNFMIGGFYLNGEQMNHVRVISNQVLALLPPLLLSPRHYVDIDSISAFGQGTWNITPELEFSAGARWTHEERDHKQYNFALPGAPLTSLVDPHIESSNLSPEFTLAYRPNSNLTVFGSYKWGFKSGSFNSATFINATTKSAFGDEKVRGAELGVKARLADGLQFNLSGYRYIYSDLQVGALELQQLPGGGGVTYALRTINAAGAKVQGLELETTYSPPGARGLSLHLAANYNHARYGSFPNAPCGNGQTAAQGCNNLLSASTGRYTAQDLSGKRLVRAPDLTASFGVDYETNVGDNGWSMVFGTNTLYSSDYTTTLVDLPGFEQSAFAKVSANIALRGPDKKWEVALIGNNLTNHYTSSLCFNSNLQGATVLGGQISGGTVGGPAGQDEAACTVERGRDVTLRFSVKF